MYSRVTTSDTVSLWVMARCCLGQLRRPTVGHVWSMWSAGVSWSVVMGNRGEESWETKEDLEKIC